MKLSEKIEAMFWAFNDAHRVGEARRLALEAQMLEVELDGLRATEEKLKEPSLVLDTGLDAKRFTAQPGELKPVANPDLYAKYKLLELQAGVRNLARMLSDTADTSVRMGLDRQADVLRGFEREARVLLGAEPALQGPPR